MNNWYKQKADFYYKQWELAIEAGKEKAADKAMTEYLNYQGEVERLKVA